MATDADVLDTHIQRAMPITRVLRLVVGLAVLLLVLQILRNASAGGIFRVVGATLAFVPFYAVVHHLVATYAPRMNRWIGALVAVAPVALAFFAGPGWVSVGALLFVGVSLLLTAVLGDPGCEVMVIPGLFFRRRTHLACISFTPLDWAEEKATIWLRS